MTPWTVHGIFLAKILEWVDFPFSRGSSQPRDWTQSPALKVDSFPLELQGKPNVRYESHQIEFFFKCWINFILNWLFSLNCCVVQSLSHVLLFVAPKSAAQQASLSFNISHSFLKLMSIESVMPSISSSHHLLLPSLFPGIGVFSNESTLRIMWPKY